MTGLDPEETRKHREATRQGLAYRGAFEAVTAILISAGLGLWIDGRFETSPWGLLIGTTIGFASFVVRLLRMGKRLQEQADAIEDENSDEDQRTP